MRTPFVTKFFFIGLVLTLVFSDLELYAQEDTTIVQTLTFSDITKRRGWYEFPDDSKTYRKILMLYTLKCDNATTQDQFPCGEWDYLTYNNIFDHTGQLDSNELTHPYFLMGTQAPDSVELVFDPVYDYYQKTQPNRTVLETISEESYSVGSSNTLDTPPLGTNLETQRVQYLWLASELSNAGLTAGNIDQLQLDLIDLGDQLNNFTIRMKHTSVDELSDFDDDGLQTVFLNPQSFNSTGVQTITLTESFEWDGSSNLLIEFSFRNQQNGLPHAVNAQETGFDAGIVSNDNNQYLEFFGNDRVMLPVDDFSAIDDEVTISLWIYGDPDVQPQNGYAFEGVNANGNRVLNCHLPWGNGNVYWDAGNEGNSYDRIFTNADFEEYAGQWNHWAFTKNNNTGVMRIYLNGELWHLGTGNSRSMAGITAFSIAGRPLAGGQYNGKIDEFRIWNKELDEATIAEWMNKSVDNSHPEYASLLYYYAFEGQGGTIENKVNASLNASINGAPQRKIYDATTLREIQEITQVRPTVTFLRGDYTFVDGETIVMDSVLRPIQSVITYEVDGNDVAPVDYLYGWAAGESYLYDDMGNVLETYIITPDTELDNYELSYFSEPFEIVDRYEIGRFITPYGIGLSLGAQGTTWIYDVTDYAFLLRDSVDFAAGNQQELIDVKFMMIEGTPPREVKQMDQIWGPRRSHSYKNLDDDIALPAQTLDLHPDASMFSVRTRFTGHGHNSNTGSYPHCCEWKDNTHYLFVDGEEVADWKIFQYNECALNAVFPQGGTWPGAREGWCPGDLVKDHDFDITPYVSGSSVTLDYDITPVPSNNQGMGNGNYQVAMQLFHYGTPSHGVDAEIYDVLAPSKRKYYSRFNPICNDPQIVIRNSGANALTNVTITYGVSGGTSEVFEWEGNLAFMEKDVVTLPLSSEAFWIGDDEHIFTVELSNPNGQADPHTVNDSYQTTFDIPETFDPDNRIRLKTNNRAHENSLVIKNMAGDEILVWDDLENNTVYEDTLFFDPGCYTLELLDTGNDGLSYWADPNAGVGYFRFLHPKLDAAVENFESEFGRSILFHFYVTAPDNTESIIELPEAAVQLSPNPTSGQIKIQLEGFMGTTNFRVIDALGREVYQEKLQINGYFDEIRDFYWLGTGLYYFQFGQDGVWKTEKVSIQ